MAKPAARRPKPKSKIDLFAGWGFWLFVCAVLYGPAWYWVWRNAYNDQKSGIFPWTAAFIIAALGAGIVSLIVNAVLRGWSHRANRAAQKKR
jgi:hypothetical protein